MGCARRSQLPERRSFLSWGLRADSSLSAGVAKESSVSVSLFPSQTSVRMVFHRQLGKPETQVLRQLICGTLTPHLRPSPSPASLHSRLSSLVFLSVFTRGPSRVLAVERAPSSARAPHAPHAPRAPRAAAEAPGRAAVRMEWRRPPGSPCLGRADATRRAGQTGH